MAEQVNMPAGFGGLMRYKEEYPSKLLIKPVHVVALIVLIIVFSIVLRIIFY